MNTRVFTAFIMMSVLALTNQSTAQGMAQQVPEEPSFNKHSIAFCPIVPFFGIYAVHYNYRVNQNSELIAGLSYMNIKFDGIGHTNSPALILGYRQYLWRNLHVEYEIWPAYDAFYESNEGRYYRGFDVWNEFRFGYKFEFSVAGQDSFVNCQMPFGFGLYSSNKPQSFKDHASKNPFFYFPPIITVGISF